MLLMEPARYSQDELIRGLDGLNARVGQAELERLRLIAQVPRWDT
jgi:hypothetical protein